MNLAKIGKKVIVAVALVLIIGIAVFYTYSVANAPLMKDVESSEYLLKEIENDESFMLYIGRPTCPECVEVLPIVENIIAENGVSVYYFNTDEHREESEYSAVLSNLSVIAVPMLISVENGEVVKSLILDYEDVEAIENFFK